MILYHKREGKEKEKVKKAEFGIVNVERRNEIATACKAGLAMTV